MSSIFSTCVLFFLVSGLILSASAESEPQAQQGLSFALQTMIQNNPAIKGKLAELNAQEHGVDGARAGRYPSFSAQADYLNDNGLVRLQQPIYAFGKINNAIDFAKAGYTIEEWDLLRVQRELIEDTAAAYAVIEGIRQRISIAQENIAEHERLHDRIKRRSEGKLASEADVRLAYSRLVQARSNLQRFYGELRIANSELLTLTQIQVDTHRAVDSRLTELPSSTDIQKKALQQSVDIALTKAQLEAVKIEVSQEKSDALPTVYFRIEHDFLDKEIGIDETRAGIAIEANFEGLGFASKARVKGARSRLNAAQYEVDVARNEIQRRVSSLTLSRETQEDLLEYQREAVTAAEATMASFFRQYKTGRKTWVEVLNTQRELTDLRIQLAQLDNEWLTVSLRIAALIGNLDLQAGIIKNDRQNG